MTSREQLLAQWDPEKRAEYEAAIADHGWPLPVVARAKFGDRPTSTAIRDSLIQFPGLRRSGTVLFSVDEL